MRTGDDQSGQKRVALVIGNGNYTSARKLTNPVNDANDVSSELRKLGFEVISGTDLDRRQMTEKIREFGDRLSATKGVGLFYYAGHGVQVGGRNYLVPVNAEIPREDEIEFAALNLDFVLQKMATANNGLNIIILDACRNNPFARGWSRGTDDGGLAQVLAPTGTFIAYATAPNMTASDGTGRNGLYTAELIKQLREPGLKIEEAFKNVTIAVDRTSGGKQIPWTSSSLRGEFYFAQGNAVAKTVNQTPAEVSITAKTEAQQEQQAWDLVKNSSDPGDLRLFLKEFPSGVNSAKAKIRLEELVWQSAKAADTKDKVKAYLDEFPSGANAAAARIRLRQLEASATVTNPSTSTRTEAVKGQTRKSALGTELAWIAPGEFMMGSTDAEVDEALYECKKYYPECKREWFSRETPRHRVMIRNGFWMGRYEVTQGQWQAVMGDNPSNFKNCGADCPVELVSWDDIQIFLKRLNSRDTEFEYRLPSEAEWEYAARAGTTTAFAFGDSLNSAQANFNGEYPYASTKGVNLGKTVKVGNYLPNAWGLYDMHGNVCEWVQDIYSSSYQGLPTDGSANESSGDKSLRVLRGGSWSNGGYYARSANRIRIEPTYRSSNIGFRLVARAR